MVLQKKLDYSFNGYEVPTKPRAPRLAKGRGFQKRNTGEENHICAFELLATVAGKLLQEGESSPIVKDTVSWERQDEKKPLKVESYGQRSCEESLLVSELDSQGHNRNYTLNKFLHAKLDVGLGVTPVINNSSNSGKACFNKDIVVGKRGNKIGNPQNIAKEVNPRNGGFCQGKVENGIKKEPEARLRKIESVLNGSPLNACTSEAPIVIDRQARTRVSSDYSIEVPLHRDHIPYDSFPVCRDDVKVVSKDDDEKSFGCTPSRTITSKAFRSPLSIGDRRIKRLLASKYWKLASKLKDRDPSNTDGEMKLVYRNRKLCYTRQRSQRYSPFKRRKLFNQNSLSTLDGGFSCEVISTSPEKCISGNATGSAVGASSFVGHQTSFQSRDSHVKFSIKSFRVPELFVEIPETATVGSLKGTVMEAVTTILGGGLRVGVLLQGKEIRDDNKTLRQTGISLDDKLDSLGFTLEPNPSRVQQPLCHEEHRFLLPPYETPQQLTRYTATSKEGLGTSYVTVVPPISNLGNRVKSDHDSVPLPTDILNGKNAMDSRALIPVSAMNVEALAVVPFRKSRRSELIQRRIRRPFSVLEVEALVQAVEKLGTGRWRDVKLRAFDNAKHRTYVDLKDKWKTLVHTARISPQQRRGQPVPQELLDRVLSAHAYWSQYPGEQQKN